MDIQGDTAYGLLQNNPTFSLQLQKVAAVLLIQATWRAHRDGYKYTAVRFGSASISVFDAASTIELCSEVKSGHHDAALLVPKSDASTSGRPELTLIERKLAWTFPDLEEFDAELKWHEQLYCKYRKHQELSNRTRDELLHYDDFCALKIQSIWRMWCARRALKRTLQPQPNGAMKKPFNFLAREVSRPMRQQVMQHAALVIQRKWRYTWVCGLCLLTLAKLFRIE